MRHVELLAPAGSMEALIAAVQNGCDAVYLGGVKFGARAYASNFQEAEMIQAIQYAHSYGVKVYVTMNTLLFETEMAEAIAYVKFLYEHDVDALIIQDLGLFDVVHQCFPDLQLHASTQMHIHNEMGIALMKAAGMKRIVLPRETTIDEVRQYAKAGIELEVFVQGALCVSYSGQCLMSAKKLGRSGNRGACAQMCRMKYRLGKIEHDKITYLAQNGEYLLSPKDLNTLRQVPQLIEAGITSFKIEGRMKRPAYVAVMVSLYRKAIDAYYEHTAFDMTTAQMQMRKIFNRGFTSGHLFQQKGSALINAMRPNHMGVEIGKVLSQKGKRIKIQLTAPLHQYDGIRFLGKGEDSGCTVNKLYVNNLLVKEAHTVAEVESDAFVAKGSIVVKTSDYLQLQEVQSSYEKAPRKVAIKMTVIMQAQKPLILRVCDHLGNHCEVSSQTLVETANKTPLDQERIIKQLKKCGDTIFQVTQVDCHIEKDVTIAIKDINECRRNALNALYQMRIVRKQTKRYGSYHREIKVTPLKGIYVSVHTLNQYLVAKRLNVSHIYVKQPLYEKLCGQDDTIGYSGQRIMKQSYPKTAVLFCENSGMSQPNAIAEHFVNITNSYAAAFLFAHGVQGIIISNECTAQQRLQLKTAFLKRYGTAGSFITYGYGREELMVMEYCPINACISDNDKKDCHLCKGQTTYVLEDLHHHRYPLYGDENCRMHILDDQAQSYWEKAPALFLSFYDETEAEVEKQISIAQSYLL